MTYDGAGRLDDPALLEAADPAQMLRQVASSAAQVRQAVRLTEEAGLEDVVAAGRPRAVVVTGMGGSGIAGEVLAAVCGSGSPAQVLAIHDYRLPGWVGAADLVMAVSCSGSTEETLATAADAVRRGCRLVGIGAAGSPLANVTEQARAPFVPVPSAGMPRSTLWGLAVPLTLIAGQLGLLGRLEEDCEAAASELERISHLCRPDSEAFVNPGKSLALELAGTLPLIWGTPGLAGVAAYRFACQLNENAKYPALQGILPEANHNQIVTLDGPLARGGDRHGDTGGTAGGPAAGLRLVLLGDSGEHPRVAQRREESARLARERGVPVTELSSSGERPLERLASLVQLIDYATVYLAIAQGIDPAPVAAIQDLRERIVGD